MNILVLLLLILQLLLLNVVWSFHRLRYDELEEQRWADVVDELKSKRISLKVFYHASKWKQYWKEVIQEHIGLLDGKRTHYAISAKYSYGIDNSTQPNVNQEVGSAGYYWVRKRFVSILEYANEMVLNVAGDSIDDMYDVKRAVDEMKLTANNLKKIKYNFNQTIVRETFRKSSHEKQQELMKKKHLTEGEVATIDLLHKYCVNEKLNNRKAFVLYFHSKGGCCLRRGKNRFDPMPVASWRESMNTFTIEFPSICVRSLLDRYVACGYNSQDSSFSGNFFFADCDHVAMLPSIIAERYNAWSAEFFIFNVSNSYSVRKFYGAHCSYSPYNCVENHYKKECSKNLYEQRLFQLLNNKTLPDNVGRLMNHADCREEYKDILKQWNFTLCDVLRNQKFEDSKYFNSPASFNAVVKLLHSNKQYYNGWHYAKLKDENLTQT